MLDDIRAALARHLPRYDGAPVVPLGAGLDNIAARHGTVGPRLHQFVDWVEQTPLRCFGISHFVVARKVLD